MTEEGPAGQAGLLVGDKLLSVNGVSLVNCEHTTAVSALKKAGDEFDVVVLREVLQSSDDNLSKDETSFLKEGEKYSTVVHRDAKQNGQFGFSVAGGISSSNRAENLYVSKTNNQNSLATGDRVLSINGCDTSNLTHDQAIDLINNGGSDLQLTCYREKTANGTTNSLSKIIDNTIEVCEIFPR